MGHLPQVLSSLILVLVLFLSCLVLAFSSCLRLSCLVLSCLVLSYLALPCLCLIYLVFVLCEVSCLLVLSCLCHCLSFVIVLALVLVLSFVSSLSETFFTNEDLGKGILFLFLFRREAVCNGHNLLDNSLKSCGSGGFWKRLQKKGKKLRLGIQA